jgi:hypothetical protein
MGGKQHGESLEEVLFKDLMSILYVDRPDEYWPWINEKSVRITVITHPHP